MTLALVPVSVFVSLATITACLRWYIRLIVIKNAGLDDLFSGIALFASWMWFVSHIMG